MQVACVVLFFFMRFVSGSCRLGKCQDNLCFVCRFPVPPPPPPTVSLLLSRAPPEGLSALDFLSALCACTFSRCPGAGGGEVAFPRVVSECFCRRLNEISDLCCLSFGKPRGYLSWRRRVFFREGYQRRGEEGRGETENGA